jgi:hypothetical protein
MSVWIWVVIGLVVLAALAFVAYRWMASRRLRDRFGDEYDRTVAETGSKRTAEGELRERQKRRSELDITELSPESRERYRTFWTQIQASFVDRPAQSVRQADDLVSAVMQERGYPVEDFEQRAADVSVDHPDVVTNFRAAHAISLASDNDKASTEDLRQAMVHYRALFEELLGTSPAEDSAVQEPPRQVS